MHMQCIPRAASPFTRGWWRHMDKENCGLGAGAAIWRRAHRGRPVLGLVAGCCRLVCCCVKSSGFRLEKRAGGLLLRSPTLLAGVLCCALLYPPAAAAGKHVVGAVRGCQQGGGRKVCGVRGRLLAAAARLQMTGVCSEVARRGGGCEAPLRRAVARTWLVPRALIAMASVCALSICKVVLLQLLSSHTT